jgi:hypothetical protein
MHGAAEVLSDDDRSYQDSYYEPNDGYQPYDSRYEAQYESDGQELERTSQHMEALTLAGPTTEEEMPPDVDGIRGQCDLCGSTSHRLSNCLLAVRVNGVNIPELDPEHAALYHKQMLEMAFTNICNHGYLKGRSDRKEIIKDLWNKIDAASQARQQQARQQQFTPPRTNQNYQQQYNRSPQPGNYFNQTPQQPRFQPRFNQPNYDGNR